MLIKYNKHINSSIFDVFQVLNELKTFTTYFSYTILFFSKHLHRPPPPVYLSLG